MALNPRLQNMNELERHIHRIRVDHSADGLDPATASGHAKNLAALCASKQLTRDMRKSVWTPILKHMVSFVVVLILAGLVISRVEKPGEEEHLRRHKANSILLREMLTASVRSGCLNATVLDLLDENFNLDLEPFSEADLHWSWSGGTFFVATVVTTIGYGSFAPRTAIGKMLTCTYAILGIGWFGFILALLSEQIRASMRWAISTKLDPHLPPRIRKLDVRKKSFALLIVLINIYLTGSIVAAMVSQRYSGVCLGQYADCSTFDNLLNAVYFSLITFTTVGLGDIAPPFWDQDSLWKNYVLYAVAALVVLVGLALIAFLINELDSLLRGKFLHYAVGAVIEAWHSVEKQVPILHELETVGHIAVGHSESGKHCVVEHILTPAERFAEAELVENEIERRESVDQLNNLLELERAESVDQLNEGLGTCEYGLWIQAAEIGTAAQVISSDISEKCVRFHSDPSECILTPRSPRDLDELRLSIARTPQLKR
jgi:hypothetical protein